MNLLVNKLSLAPGFRLQQEYLPREFILLFPEGMIKINESAAAILQLCTGQHTGQHIIFLLEQYYFQDNLCQDIHEFLEVAHGKGWIKC